jgi:hypothetical protein
MLTYNHLKILQRQLESHKISIVKGMWVLFGSFFIFSNLYQLELHKQTLGALANLR